MKWWSATLLTVVFVLMIFGTPTLWFRAQFANTKRLREVSPGKFYRSGQMTRDGLEAVIVGHGIKTVLNLQNEAPDPLLQDRYARDTDELESQLCERLGAKYLLMNVELLPKDRLDGERPSVVDQYLRLLDDPACYPILLHCRAGLHRTGLLTAIYRIEYEGWTTGAATRELKANGFGDSACTTANDYVYELLELYRPGQRYLPKIGLSLAAGSCGWIVE